jgi:hypothetical protein
MKYLPFLDGKYSDQTIFQLDYQYHTYLNNKFECRKEAIGKYYLEKDLYPSTLISVNQLMAGQLAKEYPADFVLTEQEGHFIFQNKITGGTLEWKNDWIAIEHRSYLSLFDALSSQVQEDIAICQLENDRDWLAAIHVSAPNHWSPAEKIGRPFSDVHSAGAGSFISFAWGLSTDTRLNRHPIPPPGIHPDDWLGRTFDNNKGKIYLRVERQVNVGIPACNAFMLTIRTYFYDIDELQADEKKALLTAVESMPPSSPEYRGLADKTEVLKRRLPGTASRT